MPLCKERILHDTQAIVSIVAGTASLEQEYQATVFTGFKCSNCYATYWNLSRNKAEYLASYPYCPKCDHKAHLNEISEDHDVIGAEVFFVQKDNMASASFRLTHKPLDTPNIKQMIKKCDAKYIL